MLTVLYLTEYPVLWSQDLFFLPDTVHKNLSTVPELLNLNLQGTPRSSQGDLNFGSIPLGVCEARHRWHCYTEGISNLIFSRKQSQVFHFLFSSLGFSFVFSFFSVYLFIVTRNSHIDLLAHWS